MKFWVYVLENEIGRWYIGQTSNLMLRLERHNNQKVKSTKNRGHWKLIYNQPVNSRSEALKLEKFWKSGAGRKYLKELLMQ